MTLKQRYIERESYGMLLFYFGSDAIMELIEVYKKNNETDKIDKILTAIDKQNRMSKIVKYLDDDFIIPFIKKEHPELNTAIIKSRPDIIELKRTELLTNRLKNFTHGIKQTSRLK